MIYFLTVFNYFLLAGNDLLDKFLISKKKIEVFSYTFYTVVTGLFALLAWPFFYLRVPLQNIAFNLLSGIFFSFFSYLFYKSLNEGEVSRVVPFVFAVSSVFDLIFGYFFEPVGFSSVDILGVLFLILGSCFLVIKNKKFLVNHAMLKIFTALVLSIYNLSWHFSARAFVSYETGKQLVNFFMWNRIGAAGILILSLAWPVFRKKVFQHKQIKNKKQTSFLFVFKQVLGGISFSLLSYLTAVGNVAIVTSLQGFRYVFLFLVGFVFSKTHGHLHSEQIDRQTLKLKFFGLAFIVLGSLAIFLN